MCASVIAGVDAPPILELSEHVLDFMAVPVEATVIWNLDFAVGFRGNTVRIPMHPAMHSNMKPAGDSDLIPATIPI